MSVRNKSLKLFASALITALVGTGVAIPASATPAWTDELHLFEFNARTDLNGPVLDSSNNPYMDAYGAIVNADLTVTSQRSTSPSPPITFGAQSNSMSQSGTPFTDSLVAYSAVYIPSRNSAYVIAATSGPGNTPSQLVRVTTSTATYLGAITDAGLNQALYITADSSGNAYVMGSSSTGTAKKFWNLNLDTKALTNPRTLETVENGSTVSMKNSYGFAINPSDSKLYVNASLDFMGGATAGIYETNLATGMSTLVRANPSPFVTDWTDFGFDSSGNIFKTWGMTIYHAKFSDLISGTASLTADQTLFNDNSVGGQAFYLIPGASNGPSAPGTPTPPRAVAGDAQATITVNDSMTGGTPSSFTITSNPGGLTCTVTGSSGSCTINGLTNGTSYRFTATATNTGGTSSSSAQSTPVTPSGSTGGGGNTGGGSTGGGTTTGGTTNTLAPGEQSALGPNAPSTQPTQGSSTTTVGGSTVNTSTTSSDSSDSVTSSNGGTYSSSVTFKDLDGNTTVPLTTNDTIGAEPGSDLSVVGKGFKGRSQVQVYLIDSNGNSTYLGKINTSLFGRVKGKLVVPTTLLSGKYTLQLNGFTKKKQLVKSTNLGMEVVQDDLGSLFFTSDSAIASDETKATIKEMAKSLDAGETVILYGYTSGNPESKFRAANFALAKKRTETIKNLFAAEGVKATIIIEPQGAVTPYGAGGHAKNRRVDVKPTN